MAIEFFLLIPHIIEKQIKIWGIIMSYENLPLIIAIMLIGGVIFVNGWTDAPNAITASVSTGALKLRQAVVIASVFNLLGALIMGAVNTSVIKSVGNITMMIGNNDHSLMILCAALVSIIAWAIIAWFFGIPTSESHALISGILGAVIAAGGDITVSGINSLKLAAVGLFLSLPVGGILGWLIGKILNNVELNINKIKRRKTIQAGQIAGAALMSFMHGAQDSQKFAGVILAAVTMSMGQGSGIDSSLNFIVPACAVIMAVGTSVGGYRIIKKVGMDTVSLTQAKGLAADISAVICMLAASLGGIPVSTTHTATASIIGAGLSAYPVKINKKSICDMILAWVLTFPCCTIISFVLVKIILSFI